MPNFKFLPNREVPHNFDDQWVSQSVSQSVTKLRILKFDIFVMPLHRVLKFYKYVVCDAINMSAKFQNLIMNGTKDMRVLKTGWNGSCKDTHSVLAGTWPGALPCAQMGVLPHPARSPDMNPIEHVWDYLKIIIQDREVWPAILRDLKTGGDEEWDKMPQITWTPAPGDCPTEW